MTPMQLLRGHFTQVETFISNGGFDWTILSFKPFDFGAFRVFLRSLFNGSQYNYDWILNAFPEYTDLRVILSEHFTLRLQTSLWLFEVPEGERWAEPSTISALCCGTAHSLGLNFPSFDCDPESSFNYAAIGPGCWRTSRTLSTAPSRLFHFLSVLPVCTAWKLLSSIFFPLCC